MAYSLSANFEPQPIRIFFVKLNGSLAEVKITIGLQNGRKRVFPNGYLTDERFSR